jgi:hypothetical protein
MLYQNAATDDQVAKIDGRKLSSPGCEGEVSIGAHDIAILLRFYTFGGLT